MAASDTIVKYKMLEDGRVAAWYGVGNVIHLRIMAIPSNEL